jgi:hypothetical protein
MLPLEQVASMVATGDNEGFLMAPLALMPNGGNVVNMTLLTPLASLRPLSPLSTILIYWRQRIPISLMASLVPLDRQ